MAGRPSIPRQDIWDTPSSPSPLTEIQQIVIIACIKRICLGRAVVRAFSCAIEFVFQFAGWIPNERNARIVETAVTLNYTTVLNIIFIVLAVLLMIRFCRTGGPAMLRQMK
jgi:hypothetical protein